MASLGDGHEEQSHLDSEGDQGVDGGSFEDLPEDALLSQGDQEAVQSSTQSLAEEQVKYTDNLCDDEDKLLASDSDSQDEADGSPAKVQSPVQSMPASSTMSSVDLASAAISQSAGDESKPPAAIVTVMEEAAGPSMCAPPGLQNPDGNPAAMLALIQPQPTEQMQGIEAGNATNLAGIPAPLSNEQVSSLDTMRDLAEGLVIEGVSFPDKPASDPNMQSGEPMDQSDKANDPPLAPAMTAGSLQDEAYAYAASILKAQCANPEIGRKLHEEAERVLKESMLAAEKPSSDKQDDLPDPEAMYPRFEKLAGKKQKHKTKKNARKTITPPARVSPRLSAKALNAPMSIQSPPGDSDIRDSDVVSVESSVSKKSHDKNPVSKKDKASKKRRGAGDSECQSAPAAKTGKKSSKSKEESDKYPLDPESLADQAAGYSQKQEKHRSVGSKKFEYVGKRLWKDHDDFFTSPDGQTADDWLVLDEHYTKSKKRKGQQIVSRNNWLGRRLERAREYRKKNGAEGQLKIVPEVAVNWELKHGKSVDPATYFDLPTTTMSYKDQELLVRLYALADGRCPVRGCESQVIPSGKFSSNAPVAGYMIAKSTSAEYKLHRDGYGKLTGAGIMEGWGAGKDCGEAKIRPASYIREHWLAFHMRRGLTCTYICPYQKEMLGRPSGRNNVQKRLCMESDEDPKVFRTLDELVKHLALHADEFRERLIELHGFEVAKKTKAEDGTVVSNITTGDLKGLIRKELKREDGVHFVWSGWHYKYTKLVPIDAILTPAEGVNLFRAYWVDKCTDKYRNKIWPALVKDVLFKTRPVSWFKRLKNFSPGDWEKYLKGNELALIQDKFDKAKKYLKGLGSKVSQSTNVGKTQDKAKKGASKAKGTSETGKQSRERSDRKGGAAKRQASRSKSRSSDRGSGSDTEPETESETVSEHEYESDVHSETTEASNVDVEYLSGSEEGEILDPELIDDCCDDANLVRDVKASLKAGLKVRETQAGSDSESDSPEVQLARGTKAMLQSYSAAVSTKQTDPKSKPAGAKKPATQTKQSNTGLQPPAIAVESYNPQLTKLQQSNKARAVATVTSESARSKPTDIAKEQPKKGSGPIKSSKKADEASLAAGQPKSQAPARQESSGAPKPTAGASKSTAGASADPKSFDGTIPKQPKHSAIASESPHPQTVLPPVAEHDRDFKALVVENRNLSAENTVLKTKLEELERQVEEAQALHSVVESGDKTELVAFRQANRKLQSELTMHKVDRATLMHANEMCQQAYDDLDTANDKVKDLMQERDDLVKCLEAGQDAEDQLKQVRLEAEESKVKMATKLMSVSMALQKRETEVKELQTQLEQHQEFAKEQLEKAVDEVRKRAMVVDAATSETELMEASGAKPKSRDSHPRDSSSGPTAQQLSALRDHTGLKGVPCHEATSLFWLEHGAAQKTLPSLQGREVFLKELKSLQNDIESSVQKWQRQWRDDKTLRQSMGLPREHDTPTERDVPVPHLLSKYMARWIRRIQDMAQTMYQVHETPEAVKVLKDPVTTCAVALDLLSTDNPGWQIKPRPCTQSSKVQHGVADCQKKLDELAESMKQITATLSQPAAGQPKSNIGQASSVEGDLLPSLLSKIEMVGHRVEDISRAVVEPPVRRPANSDQTIQLCNPLGGWPLTDPNNQSRFARRVPGANVLIPVERQYLHQPALLMQNLAANLECYLDCDAEPTAQAVVDKAIADGKFTEQQLAQLGGQTTGQPIQFRQPTGEAGAMGQATPQRAMFPGLHSTPPAQALQLAMLSGSPRLLCPPQQPSASVDVSGAEKDGQPSQMDQ